MKINGYWVVNGEKSDMIPFEKRVSSPVEIEEEREVLEKKHGCIGKVLGEVVRYSEIYFSIFNDERKIMSMMTGKSGFSIIEKWETFRSKPYQDSVGVWTIGYGHTRTVSIHSEPISVGEGIVLLRQDVKIVEDYINQHFPKLRQCQFDALSSLLFNIKIKDFRETRLYGFLLDDPDRKEIADEWIEFRNAGGKYLRGLMRRRLDELSLYYSW